MIAFHPLSSLFVRSRRDKMFTALPAWLNAELVTLVKTLHLALLPIIISHVIAVVFFHTF